MPLPVPQDVLNSGRDTAAGASSSATSSDPVESRPQQTEIGSVVNAPAPHVFVSLKRPEGPTNYRNDTIGSSQHRAPSSKKRRRGTYVQASHDVYPRSHYTAYDDDGNVRPAPSNEMPEEQAIAELDHCWRSRVQPLSPEHKIWKLDDFSVYLPEDAIRRPGELIGLHELGANPGPGTLHFEGTLKVGSLERRVRNVPFSTLTVDGYGDRNVTSVRGKLCIASQAGRRRDIWYALGTPAAEYARYYEPFLWIAQFGKYFIEYLWETEAVSLNHFRKDFLTFVLQHYRDNTGFRQWYCRYGRADMRQPLNAYVQYLWKEACGLDDEALLKHPVWKEVRDMEAIPQQPSRYTKTVVTQHVYDAFAHIPFASEMQAFPVTDKNVERARAARRRQLNLTPLHCTQSSAPRIKYGKKQLLYRKGHVICTAPNKTSQWKGNLSAERLWFAYVQAVRPLKDGRQKLDLLWLYEPADTTLGNGYYPFNNELFMSDNCSCGRDALDSSAVLGLVDVRWYASNPNRRDSFFVRQTFRTNHDLGAYDFRKMKEADFTCQCKNEATDMDEVVAKYRIGDAVLIRPDMRGDKHLEPCQILDFLAETSMVKVRRFVSCRRELNLLDSRVNELAFTDEDHVVLASQIIRKCHIALFSNVRSLRVPYNRDGAGDFFFVVSRGDPCPGFPPLPREPSFPRAQKLRALGIFCGGGSFDRGLEEGGVLDFRWAVDWNRAAMHTYRANLPHPKHTELFLGSVNDYLAAAMRGSSDKRIARIGEVEFIAAGNPCVGFSILQQHRLSVESKRNCSLVASVVSNVDVYMPLQMVLENVKGLAYSPATHPEQNVFSQVLCCLVSMGYQVQQFLMDPASYGGAQSRLRIFIVATAPNLEPLSKPPHTHSSPNLRTQRIGTASNNLPYGRLDHDITPFDHLSAANATLDLPHIDTSHPQLCPRFPDHRTCRVEPPLTRNLIPMIPRWPPGMTSVQTAHLASYRHSSPLGARQRAHIASRNNHCRGVDSRAWSRVKPDGLMGCITTAIAPGDAFLGRVLHWEQQRTLTVMEARRAQGLPDQEVVVGAPREQWRVIGNGVERKVAFALGLAVARVWKGSGGSGGRVGRGRTEEERLMQRGSGCAGLESTSGSQKQRFADGVTVQIGRVDMAGHCAPSVRPRYSTERASGSVTT